MSKNIDNAHTSVKLKIADWSGARNNAKSNIIKLQKKVGKKAMCNVQNKAYFGQTDRQT